MSRTAARDQAIGAVRNALSEGGLASNRALRLAQVLLTRPGVEIGAGGKIFYQGRQFTAQSFAQSNLAKYVTGAAATARNEQAINTDPTYLQTLANLGFSRDYGNGTTSGNIALENALRQQEIQFGDPNFVQGDPATAGAAAANPFSIVNLLTHAYQQAQSATAQQANRLGTYTGGGLQSGIAQNQRTNAAQNQDATMKFQQLLASIRAGEAGNNAAYNIGQQNARLATYNTLLAAGLIHAAAPPVLGIGQYAYHGLPGNFLTQPGGDGGGTSPPPQLPPGRGFPPVNQYPNPVTPPPVQ